MILKKRRLVIVSICEAILICLLFISLTFKTICVKTISDNYMNLSITNQIIDFVIDDYTDITNDQLKSLQNDLMNSKELYHFNEHAFDQAIFNIKNKNEFNIDDNTIEEFTVTCIKLIEENLDRNLTFNEQKEIETLLKNDSLWSRFSQNINKKIESESLFIKLYDLSNMWLFKIVIVIFIILGVLYIFIKGKDLKVVYFLIITLLSSLLNYLLLLIVKLMTPLCAKFINIDSLVISMESILYIAMGFLIMSLLLFVFGIMKISYGEQ